MTSTPAPTSDTRPFITSAATGSTLTATRRERQQAEILSAIRDDRVAHALDLAFEHFDQFGESCLVVEMLAGAVAERREPTLTAEFDALVDRVNFSAVRLNAAG